MIYYTKINIKRFQESLNELGKHQKIREDLSPLSEGRHTVTWYAVDEPWGVYLVRLVAGKVQKT